MSAIPQLLTNHLDIWTAADTGPKSGRGRSSANAAKVYGISKLRELILELAVRGKLVPQDASDEPASELLKRIQAEKATLIAEGKIKKDKPLPPITDAEKPFFLPNGWNLVRLNELLRKIGAGSTPLGGKQVYISQGIPFLRSQNVWDEGLKLDDVAFISTETHQKMSGTHVFAGDLLFNITGASIGRCAIVPEDFLTGNVSQHVTIVRPVSKVILKFLHLVMISRHVQQTVMDVQVGVSREGLSIGKLGQFIIPIPPLAEQHRIVAKVDELMALCGQLESDHNNATEAHEKLVSHLLGTLTQSQSAEDFSANWQRIATHFDSLFTTEASIDALKQTLLQLAVMGKLVPQDPKDEPASELLKRIQAEKAKLVSEGKIKKDKSLAAIARDNGLVDLPSGWSSVYLTEVLALITDGDHQPPPKADAGVPFLVIGNLNTGAVNFSGCRIVPRDYYDDLDWGRKPKIGDILYTVTGSYGIPIPVEGDQEFCVQRHVAILKATTSSPTRYLALMLGSKYAKDYARDVATGIAQKTVPLTGLRKMHVPLPPLEEQHRIVTKVDELMALCDQLKSRLTEASQLQQKLADVLVGNAVSTNVQPAHTGNADAKLDQAAARTLLATEVVHQLNTETRMGRVKLQKVVNLAEYVAGLKEVASEPLRNAAGPHDRHFMDQVLQGMKDRQWYEEQPVDGGKSYQYRPLAQAGQHRADYEALWSPEQRRKISDLIALMRSWKTDQCERVATLYSAWNDLLIEGKEATEANILYEVLNRWNDSKHDYTKAQWQTELAAMKMHALLIPTGFGARTIGGTQTLQLH